MDNTKTFQKTHPWIKFFIDLSRAHPDLWLMLGECQSKCEHIAGVPLRPDTAEELYKIYLAKGALATTAIEGNTLTEEQVRLHLEGKLKLPPSQEYLESEVKNVVDACGHIFERVKRQQSYEVSVETIATFNRMVLKDLKVDPETVPGELRRHSVGVALYRGAPAEDCAFLLDLSIFVR